MPRIIGKCGAGALASAIAVTVAVLLPGVAAADTQPPSAPTNLRVQGLSFTSATLTWNPSDDDSDWVMYEIEARSGTQSMVRNGSTTTSKTITGLVPGLTYTASVVAVDGSRNTSAAATVQFTTPVDRTPPTTPGFQPAVLVDGAVESIGWTAASDASAVTYILRSSGTRIYGTTRTSVTAFELLTDVNCPVQPGSTHTLTVEAVDAHDNVSARSGPITVTFPDLS